MFKRRLGELARRPHTVAVSASVAEAAAIMAREGVSCLAVVAGRKAVGFLTERELASRLDANLDPAAPVGELLSRPTGAVLADLPVDEAVRLLLERGERHLTVMEPGGILVGLVTDTELVDALAVDFMVENVTCREVLPPDPPILDPAWPVREALALMRAKNSGCVLAVIGGKPLGIFSERDAMTRILGRPEGLDEPLSQHMSRPVIVVPVDAMVYKVILFMRQKGVRRLAVVEDDGSLAGLLTQPGILAYASRLG